MPNANRYVFVSLVQIHIQITIGVNSIAKIITLLQEEEEREREKGTSHKNNCREELRHLIECG